MSTHLILNGCRGEYIFTKNYIIENGPATLDFFLHLSLNSNSSPIGISHPTLQLTKPRLWEVEKLD